MFLFLANLFLSNSLAGELYKKYEWEVSPNIAICPDTSITKKDIESAINYWKVELSKNLDYKTIYYLSSCKTMNRLNTIYITGDYKQVGSQLAYTDVLFYYYLLDEGEDPQKYLEKAIIYIDEKHADSKIVLYHEFGHAIGLGHSDHEVMKSYHFHW